MGGVKNRDEKRKKAHVYSSGGGGGTRGPAVLDKRNQELQCPHCERIFKQPGRLQDHVKKQHAGEAEPDGSDSSQATETTSLQGNREAGSSSAGAAQRMIKHALGGQPTCDGSCPLQPDSAAPGTAGAAASAPPKLMEVGSKGGYYSGKSPKLLLHELCLKEKVKPRYKAVEAGPGLWRCKVVLPHPKNSDKDVVVFLDDAHAATCQEEAAQRAAVAALSRVAGDRALERLLPRDYVPLWHALGKQRAQREERRQREAERSRAAAARQKAVSRRRGPATVYMTEDKRRLVEGLISGAPLEGGGRLTEGEGGIDWEGAVGEGDVSQHSGGGDGDAGCSGNSALLEELLLLGFSEGQAARAVAACGGGGGSGGTLPDALDWLCLHLPEDELPANFGPGAAGKPVTVLRRGTSTASLAPSVSAGTLSEADVAAATSDPAVAELLQYGYPLGRCTAALKGSGGDVAAALALLFRQLAGEAEVASGLANDSSGVDLAEWEEERMALDAIYDEAITFHSPIWTTLRLTVPGCTAASGLPWQAVQPIDSGGTPQEDAVLYLECWAPMGGAYPHSLPTLAARCPDAPPLSLLALTHQLALKALELRGHPMLFELASTAAELLPLCLGDPPPLPPGWDLAAVVSAAPAAATATLQAGEGRPGFGVDVMEGDAQSDAQHAAQRHGVHSREEPRRDGYQRRQVQQQRQRGGKEGAGARHLQPQLDVVAESRRLREHQERMEREPAHAAMRAVRAKLPAAGLRGVVVGLVEGRRVVVVSGATGCGKSTQVPQFVLEAAIAQGEGAQCGIICTQPRRISAVGLATRVAAERGERVGEVVGYSVRLDSRQSRRTRLLFCTTGILLRRLLSDPSLSGTTHVVLDEVHERSIESDLLLLLLRNLLEAGVNPGLRVVLMSATADAELFAGYFSSKLGEPSGMVTIPGFTHPVTDRFLEDALESTGFEVGRTSKWAKKAAGGGAGKSGGGGAGAPPPKKSGSKGCAAEGQLYGGYSESTRQSLQNVDEAQVNYDLVEALVARVVEERQAQQAQRGAAAAILIFAPGAEEISKICRGLQGSPRVGRAAGGGGVWVLPLHGGLPPAQQAKVFERPPKGSIKVVVATNVAETSITIDDVTCVIDCGRVKEMRFDPDRGIARLQETWVSQASALQRRGRAGRVQPGVCYRLFSSSTWGKMQKDTPPEVLRAPLQGLVLDVKGILGADVDAGEVLGQMITPPAPAALKQALGSLGQIGALDASLPSLPLTPLGQHLTRMPCDPRIGKMLVFGALLRCLDPILTIAAAQGHGRPAFFSPPDKRDEADAAKRTLTAHVAGSKSDHLAVVAAYNGWVAAVEAGGKGGGQDFCARNFIADQAMEGIKAGRQQYADILAELGFVSAGYGRAGERAGALHLPAAHDVDQYSSNARVVKAALCAGFYPQVLRVDHPAAKFSKVQGGAMETDADPSKLKFFDRHKGRVFLHPSSLNFTCGKFESGWVVYSEVVQTSKVFVRESSMVPVYALLLFGGPISVSHEEGLVRVDGWATFKAPARIAVLVRELRQQCGALLAAKIANPELDVSRSRVVEAMHHLLASDGF